MSAGTFVTSRYETNSPGLAGAIMPIRVQPETILLTINGVGNDPPAGGSTLPLFVQVSASDNEYGVKPRKATLRFTSGAPTGYSGQDVSVPLLNPAIAAAAATPGATGTYLLADVEVVSTKPEDFR